MERYFKKLIDSACLKKFSCFFF